MILKSILDKLEHRTKVIIRMSCPDRESLIIYQGQAGDVPYPYAKYKVDFSECIEIIDGAIEITTGTPQRVREPKYSWIPITERMPKLGECIITTVKGQVRNRTELRYPVHYREKTYTSGYGFYKGDSLLQDVIAWMPMPNPYEEV